MKVLFSELPLGARFSCGGVYGIKTSGTKASILPNRIETDYSEDDAVDVEVNFHFRNVVRDIILMDIKPEHTLAQLESMFKQTMEKYGIKQGTRDAKGIGTRCSEPEWVACHTLFLDRVNSYFTLSSLLSNDITAYEFDQTEDNCG